MAAEIAALAGGADALVERAGQLAEEGDARLASHLLDFALEADPSDPAVRTAVADAYDRRADDEPGLMSTNLYRSAAAYARAGRPFA